MDVRIHRPVALPPKFIGAPRVPAAVSISAWSTMMMLLFSNQNIALLGIACLFGMIITHIALMYLGTKEPHMSYLITTYHKTKQTARTIGRGRGRIFRAE
jgi:hypothetical protein